MYCIHTVCTYVCTYVCVVWAHSNSVLLFLFVRTYICVCVLICKWMHMPDVCVCLCVYSVSKHVQYVLSCKYFMTQCIQFLFYSYLWYLFLQEV